MDEYRKALVDELMQFTFLCSTKDNKILFSKYRRGKNLSEFVRLACIAIAFGYRRIFLKIACIVEKDNKKFIQDIKNLNCDLLFLWMNEFIDNIKDDKIKKLACELWDERKANIDRDNFKINQIM